MPASGSLAPSVAFADSSAARLPLGPPLGGVCMTTLIRPRNFALATDRSVVSSRFAPGLSTTHGDVPTGDPDVSPDQTYPGWLPQFRLVTSCHRTTPSVMAPQLMGTHLNYTSGVAEIAQLVESAKAQGESFIAMAPPGVELLVPLINQELRKADQSGLGSSYPFPTPPSQVVERLYRKVHLSTLIGILDQVRTTLVELVAEMCAGEPDSGRLPSRDIAEQAVDVAIYGKKNRVLINQVAPTSQGVASLGGVASAAGSPPEGRSRKVMWWIVGIAAVVAAVAAVLALLLT